MKVVSLFLYNLTLRIYYVIILFASNFHTKARKWIDGKRNHRINEKGLLSVKSKRIWFHCASLGEFEQARPVIDKYKTQNPAHYIILSFYSPSGYEVRKHYVSADLVVYLPLDTFSNARKFIDAVQPDLALFVKYEFWYYYLNELNKRNIPVLLFSSIFREEQIFFAWYGTLFRDMLNMFSKIYVQNKSSLELLNSIGVKAQIVWDTRFDRVKQIADESNAFPAVEIFKGNSKLLIAGSTWPKDDELIGNCIQSGKFKGYKYLIAPHDVEPNRIAALQKKMSNRARLLSELTSENAHETEVVIVDSIGLLASLYQHAEIAYIGGGFNAGIHNVLEPAVFGLPIVFGPKYRKSNEAIELIDAGAAFPVSGFDTLLTVLMELTNEQRSLQNDAGRLAKEYVNHRLGGSDVLLHEIRKILADT